MISWKDIESFDDENYFVLNSGETFKCPSWSFTDFVRQCVLEIFGTVNETLNKELYVEYYRVGIDTAKEILIKFINEQIESNKIEETNNGSISEFEALEKIMNMYKEGLLTDDEFKAMKQKFIGNSNDKIAKYCGNCGAEIIENSKFCIQCGTQLK